jgi:hypothetical protein
MKFYALKSDQGKNYGIALMVTFPGGAHLHLAIFFSFALYASAAMIYRKMQYVSLLFFPVGISAAYAPAKAVEFLPEDYAESEASALNTAREEIFKIIKERSSAQK